MPNMNKHILGAGALICILLAACAPAAEGGLVEPADSLSLTAVLNMESSETPTVDTATAAPEPVGTNPLTGLPVYDGALLERRPVMLKVSNFPRVGRPHAGLSYADIVFDYYIGFGTNRFLAVFYGQDSPRVGPIRSGRRVDAELVNMYGSVLGYGSADNDTDAVLRGALGDYAISHHQAPCPVFCGEDTHSATGVFADSAALSRYVSEQGLDNRAPNLEGMRFSDELPAGGEEGRQVNILFNFFNRAEWRFDAESGRYLRWIEYMEDEDSQEFEMIPLVDSVTGRQLAFSNIIIISAYYTELAPSAHEIDILGNQRGLPAVFFRDGRKYTGTWAVPDAGAPMHFYDENGEDMPLKPGSTWVAIAGFSSSLREVEPGLWELFFFLP
jgi:hypothetical protein